jgi:hypothetical protein
MANKFGDGEKVGLHFYAEIDLKNELLSLFSALGK